MNIFAHIEPFQESKEVFYYTIRFEYLHNEIEEYSEMEKFISKFRKETDLVIKEEFTTIINLLYEIGIRGANKLRFRSEDSGEALPGKPGSSKYYEINTDSKVRLYCLRLSESVVILYNGGIKTKTGAEFCPNVQGYFRTINKIAKALRQEIQDGTIKIERKKISTSLTELGFHI